jgi:antibiotic biosynthesis monooxygenase (ABM) superfamily enzyme
VRRKVKPGREQAYQAWLERLTHGVAERFTGYLGAEFHRPAAPGGEYRSVFRFASLTSLDAFERSDFRRQMLAKAAPLFAADAAWERMTGLEFWFDPPPGTRVPQPSPHRMAQVLIAVVFVPVLVLNLALGPAMSGWPLALRVLITVTIQVTLMTCVIMPRLTPLIALHLPLIQDPLKGLTNVCIHRCAHEKEGADHRRLPGHLAHHRLARGLLVGRTDPPLLDLHRGGLRGRDRQPQGRRSGGRRFLGPRGCVGLLGA